jgi:hypothetical protein
VTMQPIAAAPIIICFAFIRTSFFLIGTERATDTNSPRPQRFDSSFSGYETTKRKPMT